jgi:hypothetical protein
MTFGFGLETTNRNKGRRRLGLTVHGGLCKGEHFGPGLSGAALFELP